MFHISLLCSDAIAYNNLFVGSVQLGKIPGFFKFTIPITLKFSAMDSAQMQLEICVILIKANLVLFCFLRSDKMAPK